MNVSFFSKTINDLCSPFLVGHCSNNLLNFKMAKSLIQGYIVVSPDTPLVRSLIEPLNTPFRYANLLRDMATDLETVSMELQDAAAKSDMNVFVNVSDEKKIFVFQNVFLDCCRTTLQSRPD